MSESNEIFRYVNKWVEKVEDVMKIFGDQNTCENSKLDWCQLKDELKDIELQFLRRL
jgi:hypothetical protein